MTRLELVLREEREAIRRLDGVAVLDWAREKEAILASLRERPVDETERARLRALIPALRHNGILLAHARDILRDALNAARAAQRPSSNGMAPRAASVRMLSVRG